MYKYIISIVMAIAIFSPASFAQKAAKSAYFELGGPGIASLNYDMRFQKREDGLGFRVGAGGFAVSSSYNGDVDRSSLITVPLALNYLFGKDRRHYFELGAGATIISARNRGAYEDDNDVFNGSFGHLSFGYRMQPENGGFTFRAAITPVFGNGYFIPYYAGLSFGYKF